MNKAIIKLFEKSGDIGSQSNLLKLLKDKFVNATWVEFVSPFLDAIMSVIVSDTNIHCTVVNNMIKFAASGVSVLAEHTTKDGRKGLHLIAEIFRLCRKYGRVKDKNIRWRFCFFLNHLLSFMADGAVLSVELCDVATQLLLERLQDKKSEIRAQAAHALHRLQMPDNANCPIVEKFIFHMSCDPSVEVRTAIVKEIGMFNNVVNEMLKSTINDISDNVRKEAYNRLLDYPYQSLSSKQRQIILEKGLDDKSENIKCLVQKRLLDCWLESCGNDFVVFLKRLNVENESLCEKTLNIIFESYYDSQILDLMEEYINTETRMIDYGNLSVEKIFLWKCVAKYLTIEKKIELARNKGFVDDDYVDVLLPDLAKFSDYIREYHFVYPSKDKEFVLVQLLDMARTFAIDDFGAASLNKLCSDLILDDKTSLAPIKPISVLLDFTFKNGQDILIYIKEILNEIQSRTIDMYSFIDKVGKKETLEKELLLKTNRLEELIENEPTTSNNVQLLVSKIKKIKKQLKEINVLPKEVVLVDQAAQNLLKGFELVFQVQQLSKVSLELSLLTDIIQNIVVGYLDCSEVNIRMAAIRALSPFLLANNPNAAKEHIATLCAEISNSSTDRRLIFRIIFELFLCYDLKTFGIEKNLDIYEEYDDVFYISNVLPLLASCIDYDVDDNSFKSVVVKGFCDLLIFKKVKSINLLSKLLIIWFKRVTRESFNISNDLVQFFTSYVFYIRSSSSTLSKCYVPVFKEIDEHNLIAKLGINPEEVNSTLINITRGLMFKNEKMAINAHSELAGYIMEYLMEEQPYSAMLVDTLCKLEIIFDNDEEQSNVLSTKVNRLIKFLKRNDDKNSAKYLKKIKLKFDKILNKGISLVKQKSIQKLQNIDNSEIQNEPQVLGESLREPFSSQNQDIIEPHSDLFSQEPISQAESSDDESVEAFTKLDAMKRMSEIFKRSFKAQDETNEIESD
ncbi:condensin complex subunit 3 [Daktulosphaira vitifoliae]|uniref:condensin complex subunit 3 n=1 Tax=Daktulosphaira vitifoliae TaxID=58002 RepID=UPI0021AAC660|nr:condensin complex subunit 3 [Daktulosphaira vitifoliae]